MIKKASSRWSLNPMDRAGALLFGLFMALTFTCSVSIATAHRVEIHELIIAAIGCNLAWGFVDATMYTIGALATKNRNKTILDSIREAKETSHAISLIADALPPVIASVLAKERLEEIRQKLAIQPEQTGYVRVTLTDIKKAGEIFLFTFISTFPIVIPFLFIQDSIVALRVSNSIAIAMMFFCGWSVAKYVGFNKWVMSTSMVVVGAGLVITTVLLGG